MLRLSLCPRELRLLSLLLLLPLLLPPPSGAAEPGDPEPGMQQKIPFRGILGQTSRFLEREDDLPLFFSLELENSQRLSKEKREINPKQ